MEKINRRKFLKFALTSGIILGGGEIFSSCGEISKTAEEVEKKIAGDLDAKFLRQIITKNPATSRTLMWQTDSKMIEPKIEIKLKNSDATKIFSAEEDFFTDDGEENFQYKIFLENLQPDSEYEYRIFDGEHSTDFFALKTSSEKKFKAIIFPDSQSADYNVWGEVAKSAFEKNPDANFFVNVGDIVDNGEDSSQWHAWFEKIDSQIKILPLVPVMGNHETYDRNWEVRQPIAYLNYFAVPENNFEKFSRRFYSFDFGETHFVILDSQWDELGKEIIEVQKNWLREDLSKTSKTWKIAFIHKDVLQYKINGRPERQEGFSDVGENFMPLFEELNFDAVFTAHLHTYRNRGRLKNFQSDETGTLYILTGLSGDVRYSNLWIDHKLDKKIAPQPETDNFLTLEVDDKNFLMKCFLPDGTLIDEIELKKIFNQSNQKNF